MSCRVAERLRDVFEQYELREQYFSCILRAKNLQLQLAESRATEQERIAAENTSKVSASSYLASSC